MESNRWASRRAQAMPASPFELMDRAKAEARAKGLEIIDLSIGSSDLAPPPAALDALREATHDPATYGYCLFSGTRELREAAASWFVGRYDKALDPNRHILPLIGSQEGFANLLLAVTDPGDVILAPDPGYPSYYGAIALAGLELVKVPLLEANGFLPDLSLIDAADATRARVLVLSYPNNPTAAVAPAPFFDEAIAFCRDHDVLLVHDFPYADLVYGDYEAPSALARKGGLDVAVELYSCSKSFHMGGFRIGWAAGNEDAVAALAQVKGAVDFNQYLGIQRAAAAALKVPRSEVRKAAQHFERRRDALVDLLNRAAWPTPLPQASMYVWTRLPRGSSDSVEFATRLARETGVALGPGRAFGTEGEGYVRFALVRDEPALERAVARIKDWLD